ncbi:MAG TPA: oxidase, partial [Planctomycetaceae bacterium]|nr:oxidase [Planctomycetaceae bacterium]HCD02248.1 oxidase [Planctomycetaceae bacterium]
MADHKSHDKIYLLVFGALLVFTALSFGADVLPVKEAGSESEGWSTPVIAVIVLAIAVAKATCVMLFFMHLKWERGWKYVLLAPTTILAIGFPISLMPDIGFHYYHQVPTETMIEASADHA